MRHPHVGLKCPYCNDRSKLVLGSEVYPKFPALASKFFYQCKRCDAYVGCHPGTATALGRLANKPTRKARQAAHAAFDPLWKEGGMSRRQAYAWLQKALSLSEDECHIGMFSIEQCERVERAVFFKL